MWYMGLLIRWRTYIKNGSVRYLIFLKKFKQFYIRYIISNNLELKTECCLLSAAFFKSVFRASIPYSRHDIDYTKDEIEFINSDYLLPGLIFNNEM